MNRLPMKRIGMSGVALLLAAVCLASSGPATPPTIKLALYAPRAFYWPDQEAPPVHIIGFENSRSELRWVLSNTSDKAVASVVILNVKISPPECAAKPEYGWGSSGSRYLAAIAPHGTAVVSRDDHYPKMIVYRAKLSGTPYVQTQFAISGVYFQDGSTWPVPIDAHHPGAEPFNLELAKSAGRNCANDASFAVALDLVDSNQIVFDRESSQADDFDKEHGSIPQLHFSCTLEGPKAICHMPLEGDAAGSPAAGSPKQK